MSEKKYIKRALLILVAIVALVYWKPLLHLICWLIILYYILRIILRFLRFFAPLLMLILIIYLLTH